MCGIFFSILKSTTSNDTQTTSADTSPTDDILTKIDFTLLKKRGPDSFRHHVLDLSDPSSPPHRLLFASSVLSLRGGPTTQVTPQPVTCPHTGNVLMWNGEIFASELVSVRVDENDTAKLFAELNRPEANVLRIIESIKGPYAFVFYEHATRSVYFGRDRFGRRSLLVGCSTSAVSPTHRFTLSSVQVGLGEPTEYQELRADGVYKLDLARPEQLVLYKWRKQGDEATCGASEGYLGKFEVRVSSDECVVDSVEAFNECRDEFEDDGNGGDELVRLVDELYAKLRESVRKRVENVPNLCKLCSSRNGSKFLGHAAPSATCEHAKVAVLFSGGVDSAVLAALVDECLPPDQPIDLLNIAFEQTSKSKSISHFEVPDRVSGRETLKELQAGRAWNFVEVNVGLDELKTAREATIRHLLYPHRTVLDDSIGCALWFASRGVGANCTSHAEVLFVGMGADEQLAGYVRHRTRYEKGGMAGLCDEVKMEIERIAERNLGRDDRILSDHGKESRLPFLDEDLVSFLNQLPMNKKCNMKLGRGIGEKHLLRAVASKKLNLNYASRLQKRAIQFGSRVAKMENTKEKASDICDRIATNLNVSNLTDE